MNIIFKTPWLVLAIIVGCATSVEKPTIPTETSINVELNDITKKLKVLDKNDPRAGVFFKSDSFGNISIRP